MENDKFKEIETLMELDARHDAILNSLEELDKQIETAIRAAQEEAAKDDALDAESQPDSQSSI
ncbi:MAG: hypothetical protein IKS45_05885 [Thermoguttaceae bacterium]|nr:hypothetical protein [Thermoguttaceae bacterium]MBR6436018.1 hypothetical protein [Thermoguttaceae bacterium]